MKQLKANNTDKYIHFGRSLFEIIPDETQGIVYPVHTKKSWFQKMSRNESLEPTSTLDKWLPTYKPTFKPMHEEHQSTAKIKSTS